MFGYARVSTVDQTCHVQEETLRLAGCEIIRSEHRSGSNRTNRPELNTLLTFLRPGDTLACTRVDRLGRSVGDLQDVVRDLRRRGVSLLIVEQDIDTSTSAGNAFLNMLGVFAEFENGIRKERQAEGIAKAKARGVYKGRKRSVDVEKVRSLAASGLGASEVARKLSIGRASVYRALAIA